MVAMAAPSYIRQQFHLPVAAGLPVRMLEILNGWQTWNQNTGKSIPSMPANGGRAKGENRFHLTFLPTLLNENATRMPRPPRGKRKVRRLFQNALSRMMVVQLHQAADLR
jgi:hypothetical protein